MDKYIIIKNGLVLTLDRKGQTGYFNIIIKNNKIFLIDYENKFNEKEFRSKNPDAVILDAKDKLIMPGFFNSKLISSYTLNKIFFKKCTYQNINSWLSLKWIENYLSRIENAEMLRDLLKINYLRSLKNGEIFINESSPVITKDFSDVYFTDHEWIKQYYNLTAFDFKIPLATDGSISYGIINDENVNNYSLTSVKKNLSGNKVKLFIEASLSENTFDSIRKVFGRTFINVLAEMDMISADTIISNPTHISPVELEILKMKNATVLLCPSDFVNLSDKKLDLDELISSGINLIIGTGYTGTDILTELKILSTLVSKNLFSYENILQTAILNPSLVYGVSNLTGIIDRNRSADLIFFDLKDLRNTLSLPETDKDNVCEFIVHNLSSKDISDVMIKGELLIKDRTEQFEKQFSYHERSEEISHKLYSAGKYFEYKEKYLMRGRVDRLSLENTGEEFDTEKKAEIFVDMTETGEYVGEGEFTILGTKEEEFEKPRERDKEPVEKQFNLQEIKSLENDLNLFEGFVSLPKNKKNRPTGKKTVKDTKKPEVFSGEKISFSDINEDTAEVQKEPIDKVIKKEDIVIGTKEANEDIEATDISGSAETAETKAEEISVPKKTKLKFGFKDGE
ncbi:MAG TPA: amidohydrolase family protein [Ignavibacteria bacterium]|nr:amidohydrolase family protein [Ignavibacteria bacterium]